MLHSLRLAETVSHFDFLLELTAPDSWAVSSQEDKDIYIYIYNIHVYIYIMHVYIHTDTTTNSLGQNI